jgi:hypothetical protein
MTYLADAELIRMSAFCQAETKRVPASIRPSYEDTVGAFSSTYSPISTNGIATASSMSQVTPESLAAHSSTSSNNSFYQPAPTTPNLGTYQLISNAQPATPQSQQAADHFVAGTFDPSPSAHSSADYFPSVTSANETLTKDEMMSPQLSDLQMNNC